MQVRDASAAHDRQITEKEQIIADLQRELDTLRVAASRAAATPASTLDLSEQSTTDKKDRSVPLQNALLKIIAESQYAPSENKLYEDNPVPKIHVRHALDMLLSKNLVEESRTTAGSYYKLTTHGHDRYVREISPLSEG